VSVVFSGLSALVIEDVADEEDLIRVRARTPDGPAACPGCGTTSRRVHAFHERTLADVPVDARQVAVVVRVRRLTCVNTGCRRQTFREQVPGVMERYQRRTSRLTAHIGAVVRELAGRAGCRVLSALAVEISPGASMSCPTAGPTRLQRGCVSIRVSRSSAVMVPPATPKPCTRPCPMPSRSATGGISGTCAVRR
jgi:transposase IS204/IS1001/IS1096/IS1165 family protein